MPGRRTAPYHSFDASPIETPHVDPSIQEKPALPRWRRFCGSLPAVLFVAVLPALMTLPRVLSKMAVQRGQTPSWLLQDLDTKLIHHGLIQAPGFPDTFRWWVGAWVGQVPFYRPLTSYLFWVEWKTLGNQEHLYLLPGALAHVAATFLFAVLAYRLAGHWRTPRPWLVAIVGGWAFAGVGLSYREGIVWTVLSHWKNQPDTFATICCFLALLCYVRQTRPRLGLPWAAAGWYLAACGFKEAAIGLPLVCGVLDLERFRQQERPFVLRRWFVMAGAGVIFLIVRFCAIRQLGYTYGTNDRWLDRTLLEAMGPFAAPLVYHEWATSVMSVFVCSLAVFWWRRQRGKSGREAVWLAARMIGILAVGTLAIRVWYLQGLVPIRLEPDAVYVRTAEALLFWEDRSFTESVFAATLILIAISALWKRCRAAVALALVWAAAFLAPVTLSPGPVHRYYLPEAGYLLAGALAAAWIVDTACAFLASTMTPTDTDSPAAPIGLPT